MKRNLLKIVAGVGLLALIPTAAMAHSDISVGVNLGGGYVPAPIYAAPAPVYYGPAPVAYGYGYGYGYHDGWRHREWQEHRWHEDHGWRDGYRR